MGEKLQVRLLCGAAMLSLVAFAGVAHAEDTARYEIPPQSLDSALRAFGAQSGHPILVTSATLDAKKSPGLFASADPETALRKLLAGTGLSYTRDGQVFAIVVAENTAPVVRTAAKLSKLASESVSGSAVEGLVVTAQKRRENIQDVPIAISAFSADALQAQKIEGGFDLLKAIPNVTFSKNNFSGYNFSIRGIGTKAISATTDPGVAVAFNNTTLIQNRLFEQEYFDVERVEVLRGPQGTLYGRNATSGVINLISNKADLSEFDGSLKAEVGNYHTKRLSGMINVPLIEDVLAVRFAGALTNREGYDFNTVTDSAVNGRDLWSGRLTIGFQPTERFRANFIWERFNEDDNRSRTGKQLCHHDDGPTVIGDTDIGANVGGTPGTPDYDDTYLTRRALFGQGCKPGNLYDAGAFGTPNGLSYNFILGLLALRDQPARGIGTGIGVLNQGETRQTIIQMRDPYGNMTQSRDLREIASIRDPIYRASADLFELNVDFDVTPHLTFSSQTAYNEDQTYSFQDYNRFNTLPVFTDTAPLFDPAQGAGAPRPYADFAAGGTFCDPQLGCSKTIAGFDIAQANGTQFSQEFRLQSSFDGPFNFSVGVNYTKFETLVDYYIMFNLLTAMAEFSPFNIPINDAYEPDTCAWNDYWRGSFGPTSPVALSDPRSACPYVDRNPLEAIDGEGHNYFRSKNPYSLKSWAGFGEAYWNIQENLKLTAGVRYTDDRKDFVTVPSQLLLAPSWIAGGTVAKGYPEGAPIKQKWGEFTGRLGLDWKPDVAFTDETLLYAFYSRGYKGGGANPPRPGYASPEEIAAISLSQDIPQAIFDEIVGLDILPILKLNAAEYGTTFEPEFVNAFEVGSKNTLFGGGLTFNATAFYYDYKNYQVSQIRDRSAINENFDAKTWGLEFETMLAPSQNLQIIANIGYLDTEIADGETSIDIMNRTQGNANYTLAKPWSQLPSNCVLPTPVVESYLADNRDIQQFWKMCGLGGFLGYIGSNAPLIDHNPAFSNGTGVYDPSNYPELNDGAGLLADLGGNELPNAPHVTANLGAQYSWDLLGGEWNATVRGDAYWQSQSWARVYNFDPYDKLHGWYNLNLSMKVERPEDDLTIEFYVKNVLDDTPITDAFLNSDDTGLTTNVFTLDPRLIGLSVTKGF